MDLIIDGYLIDEPIMNILYKCKSELTNGKLSSIIDKGGWVSIPCPFHSDGLEQHNSCGVVSDPNSTLEYGVFNCFTCKTTGHLYELIGACFGYGELFGKSWLIKNFGKQVVGRQIDIPRIELKPKTQPIIANESILDTFQSWHPYMQKRKLTKNIVDTFKIKYDPNTQCIIFPVWDENNKYLFYTSRNVNYKQFNIPKDVEKPIYLMNYINSNNINKVVVCESQLDALRCYVMGVPAIALFGSSLTKYQKEILNRSGVRNYVLALDGDEAGKNGIEKFKKMIRKDVFIDVVDLPYDRDINDLSDEEFISLFKKYYKNLGEE